MGRTRIRTIKPVIWEHEKLGRLSRDERLLFIVLITMADDDGRLRALPRQIIGHGYSHDRISERQVEKWLGSLERNQLITRYGTGREVFLAIRGFRKHQRINRYTASVLPSPPGEGHPADELFGDPTFHPQLSEASHPEVEVEGSTDKEGSSTPSPARERIERVRRTFAQFGIEVDDVSVMRLLDDFPALDLEREAGGCAEYIRAHPGKPPGLTFRRWLEKAEQQAPAGRSKQEREADDLAALERLAGGSL
jgi:hypothetical protein